MSGLRAEAITAVGGWIAMVVAWVAVTLVDPTATGNRPRRATEMGS